MKLESLITIKEIMEEKLALLEKAYSIAKQYYEKDRTDEAYEEYTTARRLYCNVQKAYDEFLNRGWQ